jgi:class 3 adenylate cyclase
MRAGRFYVLVGLKFNSRLLGCIALGRKVERKPFSLAEIKLLETLKQDISIALSNALMYSSLIEKVNEMNTLNRLAIENQDKHTRASVIAMVCDVLAARLPFERISYFSVEFVEQALMMEHSISKNLLVAALPRRLMIKLGDGPVGIMVMRRSELCVNYLHRTPREDRSEIERWLECSSYAMIPIAHSGVPVGVLLFENFDQKSEIRRETTRYLTLLSQHIGGLLENFEMYHDIKEQVASLKIVTEAAFAMSGSLDIESITREVLGIIKKTFALDHAGVFFYNSGHDILHKGIATAASPWDEKLFARLKFRGSDTGNPFAEALKSREPVIIDEVSSIAHKVIRSAAARWGKGMGIFPVTVRRTAIAVLVLNFDTDRRKLSQEFQSVIASLTRFYATALENARSFQKVETINANLEKLVEDRTREAETERRKSDALLLNILPKEIADDLKVSGESKPTYYADVTVLFTDFVGFTQIAEAMSAEELVDELNVCFRAFDVICEKHNLEKLKTIGDAYMAAGGLPLPNETHPIDMVSAALEIVNFMEDLRRQKTLAGKPFWELRCGIHTGPVVAGVIGSKKFAYDIWGDTVNMASRMESSGVKGKVNISAETFERVRHEFACEHRGQVEAKRKGKVDMYLVIRKKEPVTLEEK